MLRLNLITEEDHCLIFGNIQAILALHEGETSGGSVSLRKSVYSVQYSMYNSKTQHFFSAYMYPLAIYQLDIILHTCTLFVLWVEVIA